MFIENIVLIPFFVVLGVVVGSFLNVVVLRHEKEETVGGRSYCPTCHKTLRWYELIPVCSYLIQNGKCRGCGKPISTQYLFVEVVTGAVFGLLVTRATLMAAENIYTPSVLLFLAGEAAVWSLLIVITVYDLRTMLIPDRFSYTFAILALMVTLAMTGVDMGTIVAGPLLFLPFYGLWKYSNGRWMGLGDGKLAWGMGWYLGLVPGLSAVMFAFWIGALVSLVLIFGQKMLAARLPVFVHRYTLRSEIPFGPYLILGTALVHFTDYTILTFVG